MISPTSMQALRGFQRRLEWILVPVLDPQYRIPEQEDLTELLDLGVELCRQGNWPEGLDFLARLGAPRQQQRHYDGLYYAYLGYGTALVRGRIDEGLRLCRMAVDRQPGHPDNHLYLARTLLLAKRRYAARRVLRDGLAVDPAHAELLDLLRRMGMRRASVLSFLPRDHWLNRILGRIRHRYLEHSIRAAARRLGPPVPTT